MSLEQNFLTFTRSEVKLASIAVVTSTFPTAFPILFPPPSPGLLPSPPFSWSRIRLGHARLMPGWAGGGRRQDSLGKYLPLSCPRLGQAWPFTGKDGHARPGQPAVARRESRAARTGPSGLPAKRCCARTSNKGCEVRWRPRRGARRRWPQAARRSARLPGPSARHRHQHLGELRHAGRTASTTSEDSSRTES